MNIFGFTIIPTVEYNRLKRDSFEGFQMKCKLGNLWRWMAPEFPEVVRVAGWALSDWTDYPDDRGRDINMLREDMRRTRLNDTHTTR